MKELAHIFHTLSEPQPPKNLVNRIMVSIVRARRRQALQALGLSGLAGLLSLAALAEAVRYVFTEAYLSGFTEYMHLLLTDRALLSNAWQQFIWSLAESLPANSLVLVCATLGALVWSLSRLMSNVQSYRLLAR